MNQKRLTETQRMAVQAIGKNLCVSAGAGTGKTNVLVERFIYLIENKLARPHEILAITFTDKAAQEMKARIAKQLRERGLEQARRELENAYIGTIHSFCARILREHPIEAEVDPDFRVFEEEEANLLKETVLEELIEARFQDPAVFDLLRIYSEKSVRKAIREMASRAHTFGMSLLEAARPSGRQEAKQSCAKVLEALQPLKTLRGKEEDCSVLEEALKKPVSNWDELEVLKELVGRFRRHKARPEIGIFKDQFNQWIVSLVELLTEPACDAFLSLACDFETSYRGHKRERAVLDFDDLEREAVRLIEGREPRSVACRNLYRENFKFIMVDEFQDTAPLQDRLITLIARPDNLLIVGDWKQSIFGFRGARASVFLEKERAFSEENAGMRIPLVENFRSREELLNQINPFFEKLWVEEGRSFEPLVASRAVIASATPDGLPHHDGHAVEFLTIERQEGESIQEARMKEARVLAKEIQRLVSSGAYEYKDFAMLFRVGTNIFFYEYELRNLCIPYYAVSGRGFYHQPEVKDLISFLEVLENPHLDIPLAAVLRSPLVQISDDALFWLANSSTKAKPSTPLYHAFLKSDDMLEIREADQDRIKSFRAFFLQLLEQKEKWTTSGCLELILERTQYSRYVLGLPQGKRHFANLKKLLDIAREAETREPIHLGDFIRYVKGLETQEVRESEAQVEALEGNVVKLMTIHKAKGLEFKVVIIPDLNRKGEKQKLRFLIDPKYGLGARAFNEVTRAFEDTPTYRRIKDELIQMLREESKRLLYVGMTRAENHLILSGVSKADEDEGGDESSGFDDGANWYEWVCGWCASGSGRFEHRVVQALQEKKGKLPSPLAEHKKIKTALEQNQPIPIKVPEGVDQIIESLKSITPVYFERIDLPVTAFSTFEHDPEEFRRIYELGALSEEDSKIEEWVSDEDEAELSPADFGTSIHKIFEHLVSEPQKANERLPHLITRFAGDLEPKTREELYQLSLQFIKSKQFSEIREAKRRCAEFPFVFRLQGGIIQGTLDLLYQTTDGKWIILDYKTSQVNGKDLEKTAGRYQHQLLLYALACHTLLKIPISRAALYFVRIDQTYDFSLEGVDFVKLRSDFEMIQKTIIATRKAWI